MMGRYRYFRAGNRAPLWPLHLDKDHPATQGLKGLWLVGSGWRDLSGKTNINGTRVGTTLGARKNNQMEIFDANTDAVTVNNTPLSQTGKYTIWVWAVADSLTVNSQSLFKNWSGAGAAGGEFHFGRKGTTSLLSNFLKQSDDVQKGPAQHHINMPTGELTCFATRADGATLDVWQDGVRGNTTVAYDGTLRTNNSDVAIGNHSNLGVNNQGWIGGILMVGFSDQAFSNSVMFNLWNPAKRWDYFWQPGRVLYYIPGLSIPVAMNSYRQHHQSVV